MNEDNVTQLLPSVLAEVINTNPRDDNISTLYKCLSSGDPDARKSYIYFFTKYNLNKPVKKMLLQGFEKDSNGQNLMVEMIRKELEILPKNERLRPKDLLSLSHLLHFFGIFFEKYDKFLILDNIFPLYEGMIATFVQDFNTNFCLTYGVQNVELMEIMNNVLKQILLYFGHISYKQCAPYCLNLLQFSYDILKIGQIGFDFEKKCSLIFIRCLNLLLSKEETGNFPIISLLKNREENILVSHKDFELKNILHLDGVSVVVYSAIFQVYTTNVLLEHEIEERTVFEFLFGELTTYAKNAHSNANLLTELTRSISLTTNEFYSVPVSVLENLFPQCLFLVFNYSEYFIDSVQKSIRSIVNNLVNVSVQHFSEGEKKFVYSLLKHLKIGGRKVDFQIIAGLCPHVGCTFLLKNIPDLRENIVRLLDSSTEGEHAFRVYECLMRHHYKEINKDEWIDFWVQPNIYLMKNSNRPDIHTYRRIVCAACQINQCVLQLLIPDPDSGQTEWGQWGIILQFMKYIRTSSDLNERTIDDSKKWKGLIEFEKLKLLMISQDEAVRVATLSVIVDSQKSTELFTEWEFEFLIDFFQFNCTSQIPYIRKQVTHCFKTALTRYFASYEVIKRNMNNLANKAKIKNDSKVINFLESFGKFNAVYKRFLKKFTLMSISYLAPDGNFSRRSSVLELLIFMESRPGLDKKWWRKNWTDTDIQNLMAILYDSYESNKKMAADLLRTFDVESIGFKDKVTLHTFLNKALELACNIVPCKTISAAYLVQVCTYAPNKYYTDCETKCEDSICNILAFFTFNLTKKIELLLKTDINEAVKNAPLYGLLSCIRHILLLRDKSYWHKDYSKLFNTILDICKGIEGVIMPTVTNASPEGYLPENLDDLCVTDATAKSQLILVYAWRTMKEMTLLLAEVVVQTTEDERLREVKEEKLIEIGELFMTIFQEAKHRGVFEQAYNGFSMICHAFWRSDNSKLKNMPKIWLQYGLDICAGSADVQLSSTRRSAGLPFMILALVATLSTHDKMFFHTTMQTLTRFASEEEPEMARTHCMNTLRALFRSTKLSEFVTSYVARSTILAIKGFAADLWNVRNSATLLYASLITRIFGVQRTTDSEDVCAKNKMTSRVFETRYPDLYDFLIQTLKMECSNQNSLLLHPVLIIFSRLYPSSINDLPGEGNEMSKYLQYMTKCVDHSVFKTRELAAKSVPAFVSKEYQELTLESLLTDAIFSEKPEHGGPLKNNTSHGLLLVALHMIRSFKSVPVPINDFLEHSVNVFRNIGNKFSPMVAALVMEIAVILLEDVTNKADPAILEKMLEELSNVKKSRLNLITANTNFKEALINLKLIIYLERFEYHKAQNYDVLKRDLMHILVRSKDQNLKTHCLYFLLCLNKSLNEIENDDNPLFVTEEITFPQSIKELVDAILPTSTHKFLTFMHKYIVCFLLEELKTLEFKNRDHLVLTLMLVQYYPCVIWKLNNGDKTKTLDIFLTICDTCDNEEICSAILNCMGILFKKIDITTLNASYHKKLIDILLANSVEQAADCVRLSVAKLVVDIKGLFYVKKPLLKYAILEKYLNLVMILLEDDDLFTRDAISLIVEETYGARNKIKVISEKARTLFLDQIPQMLSQDQAISFLFSWANRHFPDTSKELSEIFERTSLNQFAENIPIVEHATKVINNILWSLKEGLSYDDKSIFLEEKCLMVTTILINSLKKYPHFAISCDTRKCALFVLGKISNFLETVEIGEDFYFVFSTYFEKIIKGLWKVLPQKDCCTLVTVLRKIYDKALNPPEKNTF